MKIKFKEMPITELLWNSIYHDRPGAPSILGKLLDEDVFGVDQS